MKETKHAAVRIQQRGIPPLVVDLLLQFGRREHDHNGAEILYFDRGSKNRIKKYSGGVIGKLSEHLQSYAVLADGNILTVGTRYKKIYTNK